MTGHVLSYLRRTLVRGVARRRRPDFVVGTPEAPYLRRWWLVPRNPLCNVYLHQFLRSDDDRALHDHPWPWASLVLVGGYTEHTILAGGIHVRREYQPGALRVHGPRFAHRIELPAGGACWTLFITGPRVRGWGFHCPAGWRPWRIFTNPTTGGATVGRGCE